MRSAPTTAASILGVNDNLDCDAPGARPNRLRAGHAASTNRFRAASAFGAISVATTSRPLARYSAAQLAPMTPVPMIATRRMGPVVDIVRSPFDQVQICLPNFASRAPIHSALLFGEPPIRRPLAR